MKLDKARWMLRRLSRMSPSEVGWRIVHLARQVAWKRLQILPGQTPEPLVGLDRTARFASGLKGPLSGNGRTGDGPTEDLIHEADLLLTGHWETLGVLRSDMAEPDWFQDPRTGRRAPSRRYAPRIDYHDEELVGDIKQVWEPSRLQHLTVLAAAWYVTGDDRYADCAARQLQDWWQANPFMSGVNWTSGIEVGIRLVSFVWIRRLLDGWEGVAALFEESPLARQQIYWHQRYLAGFESRGTSANNHVIVEAAGRLSAACAFDWYPESDRWRADSTRVLEREIERNTFPSGVNRELASGYHCFVAETGLLAAVEARLAGHDLREGTWRTLCRMVDATAALVDKRGQLPRQGDGDDGRAVLIASPRVGCATSLLALGDALFGRLGWWPATAPDVRSQLLGTLADRRVFTDRPAHRPGTFPDAGITLLRSKETDAPEIWCRCDGGPHGFLSIAAHAHADALSVELRVAGVDVLADPGTFCYHNEPRWRTYFRSTLAHNTVELGGSNQSVEGGPFLWVRHANAQVLSVPGADDSEVQEWSARLRGYPSLESSAASRLSARGSTVHRRTVRLSFDPRVLEITDTVEVTAPVALRLPFHLGPEVHAKLDGTVATLEWPTPAGPLSAHMTLPESLDWAQHRGEVDPILGWYSPRYGVKQPSTTLLGSGLVERGCLLVTRLEFHTTR